MVPRFDAHIEVYGSHKTVRIQYDTPYVKGLPITMHICENDEGAYKETTIRKSYEDAYTREMKVFWDMCVEGKSVKTTARDAVGDLEVFGMAMKFGYGPLAK
jgi:predicted dehydrogenase